MNRIKPSISAIKTGADGFSIPIQDDRGPLTGRLKPITHAAATDARLIALLTEWRNTHGRFFLTRFEATPERTRRWLVGSVLPDEARLMFMIEDGNGDPVGHVGVRRLDEPVVELDNMIRGRSGGGGQLMFWSEIALLVWVFNTLKARGACLHVFTNNWIPISIHQAIGFKIADTFPLVRRKVGDEMHLVVGAQDGELQKFKYAKMVLSSSDFQKFLSTHPNGV